MWEKDTVIFCEMIVSALASQFAPGKSVATTHGRNVAHLSSTSTLPPNHNKHSNSLRSFHSCPEGIPGRHYNCGRFPRHH